MLEPKFCTYLRRSKQNAWNDTTYAVFCAFIYMPDITSLSSFLLFHFIFELLGIIMLIMNIIKTELINATESFWLNIFSVRNFSTNGIIPFLFHSHLVNIKEFRYDMEKHIAEHIEQ